MLKKNYTKENGKLCLGGIALKDIGEKYGTPTYIYDQKLIKDTVSTFLDNFRSEKFDCKVSYASKASSNLYLLGLLSKLGLSLDTVSKGEIFIALKAGFKAQNIHFHGNNKTEDELKFAVSKGIGQIIVDSYEEFILLEKILVEMDKKIDCLLRINPDVSTNTHKFIQTSNADSKFGINIRDPRIYEIIKEMLDSPYINLLGFHAHIGSQVTELGFFKEEAEILFKFTKDAQERLNHKFTSLNLGGGFGVRQSKSDPSYDLGEFLKGFVQIIESLIYEYDLDIKNVGIEPGRSLINQAGLTLYTVGSKKNTLEGLPLVFVDGGMSDNIRPALYQAEYDAYIVDKKPGQKAYRVGGKLCESGDILIEKTFLNDPQRGDLLVIENTGAYSLAMASNYNKIPRPAVVFVEDGKDFLAVRRENLEDLIARDFRYKEDI